MFSFQVFYDRNTCFSEPLKVLASHKEGIMVKFLVILLLILKWNKSLF